MAGSVKKERQHHVWQHYLRSWAVGGRIFALRDGEVHATGTRVVAVERDFYRLQDATREDFALLHLLAVDKASPDTKRMHEKFLNVTLGPLQFLESFRTKVKAADLPKLEVEIDTYKTNALENYHGVIERKFIPVLDLIKSKDLSFYSRGDECAAFVAFISAQYMRTKGIKVRSIDSIKEKSGKDLSRVWSLMSLMFAANIAVSLFSDRQTRKLVLLENKTGGLFITGDQPAINLLGTAPLPPESLSIFYPVSPVLAVILTEANQEPLFTSETMTADDVSNLNRRIVDASHSQVFAQAESDLTPFK